MPTVSAAAIKFGSPISDSSRGRARTRRAASAPAQPGPRHASSPFLPLLLRCLPLLPSFLAPSTPLAAQVSLSLFLFLSLSHFGFAQESDEGRGGEGVVLVVLGRGKLFLASHSQGRARKWEEGEGEHLRFVELSARG